MFRFRVLWTGGMTGPGVSTFYFDDDLTSGNVTAARSALNTFWTSVSLYQSTAATYSYAAEAEEIDISTGHVVSSLPIGSGSSPGSATGDLLPPATQGLIRWRTGVYITSGGASPRAKEVRGRTFVPAITEGNSTSGVPSTTMIGAFNSAAAALIADASTHLCVYSRANAATATVTSGSAWNQFATLRSRRD